jgi:predicted RNA-binding Zn-ribbon protein involved in translation (DUF1610 family)
MIATQEVTCPKCGELSSIRNVLSASNVESFSRKPQQFTCPKCESVLERPAASGKWKLKQPKRPKNR